MVSSVVLEEISFFRKKPNPDFLSPRVGSLGAIWAPRAGSYILGADLKIYAHLRLLVKGEP